MPRSCLAGFTLAVLSGSFSAGCQGGAVKLPTEQKVSYKLDLTAEEFAKMFIADRDSAREAYQDKSVNLTGEVVVVHGGKDARIELYGAAKQTAQGPMPFLVFARLKPEFKAKALQLSPRQKVKVAGFYKAPESAVEGNVGGSSAFFIYVDDCTLEEHSKSEMATVKAEEMAKEFAADAKAALAKYGDKDVLVLGEVKELAKPFVTLKGDGMVAIRLTVVDDDDFSMLVENQPALVRGKAPQWESGSNEIRIPMAYVVEVK